MRKTIAALTLAAAALGGNAYAGGALHGYQGVYWSYINYSGSGLKNYGVSSTYYVSGFGKHNGVQFGYSATTIKYKNGLPKLKQNEITLLYSNTNDLLKNHTFTLGGHYISTNDTLSRGAYTFIFDCTYSNSFVPYYYKWSGGLSLYYTRYPNEVGFSVIQFTPHGTYKVFSDYNKGALYVDLTGYGIHLTKDQPLGLGKKNYYSIEGALRYYFRNYDFKLGGWVGKQVFAVKNGGFVVYNLTEKYKGGAEAELGYTFSSGVRIAANVSYNRYRELSTNDKVNQTVFTATLGYKF
ncbi:hypothetical protein [Thermovibrio sp.]